MYRLVTIVFVFHLTLRLAHAQNGILVFQSDFGVRDGAVSAMKGVAMGVSASLKLFDLTHEIPPYNIWEASYRLNQTVAYWPAGTVFVSIVDPGVGSERKSIVMKSVRGPYFFVTPDNGTLTLVAESLGIEEVRQIDETRNRLPGSSESYTFHGRDVYAFTGARLAAGAITFKDVGKVIEKKVVTMPYQKAEVIGSTVKGTIDVLDIQYGNVWTNIGKNTIDALGITYGSAVHVTIFKDGVEKFQGEIPLAQTFSAVPEGAPVAYFNSLLNFSVGINMGNFAEAHNVSSGAAWTVLLEKSKHK
jgi:S-adenosylmethionine hydrolase